MSSSKPKPASSKYRVKIGTGYGTAIGDIGDHAQVTMNFYGQQVVVTCWARRPSSPRKWFVGRGGDLDAIDS